MLSAGDALGFVGESVTHRITGGEITADLLLFDLPV